MSTGTTGSGGSPAAVAAGGRGSTRIADRVVAKTASQAAREAIGPLPSGAAPPHASVAVRRDAARVRVHIELGYPDDIGSRCARVRRQIVERVREVAGLAVPEVVVQVERLHPTAAPGVDGRTR